MNKTLIVVVGPTAVGKTGMAIKLGQHFNTEIISADARQVFKEMTIGTAKPTSHELQIVKHHLIDSHSIHDSFDAASYALLALNKINALFTVNNNLILCGGSGLYIKGLLEGFDEMPEVKPGIRDLLNKILADEGILSLQKELKNSDLDYYNIVDKQNPQRLIRALEVIRTSGKPYSYFRNRTKIKLPFQVIKIGLELPRQILNERIDKRMDNMIASGLFEDARQLYPHKNINALQTVGYKEIFDFLDGKYNKEEAIRLLKQNTRHYAKRQMTWFKKDKEIRWFSPDDFNGILNYIEENSSNLQA